MAEIQSRQLQQKHCGANSKRPNKKNTTRVDLTPMVDLGFLLITFFVFTTSLSKATAIKLALPSSKSVTDSMILTSGKALTLILVDENTVGYYNGADIANMQFTNYYADGLRNIIIKKQTAVLKKYGDRQQMMVLIKPTDKADYQNVVETLDEMLITNVKSYMLLDITAAEQMQVNKKK